MIHTRLLITAILGLWLGWTLAMWFAATRSFRTVDRILKKPNAQFSQALQPLTADQGRVLFRYIASEANRTYFAAYGWSQIVIGSVLLILVWREPPRDTVAISLAGVMLALVLLLTWIVQPMIVSLGRSIDFIPRNPAPAQMPRFWMLHGAYTGLDAVKLLAGLGLLARLLFK